MDGLEHGVESRLNQGPQVDGLSKEQRWSLKVNGETPLDAVSEDEIPLGAGQESAATADT